MNANRYRLIFDKRLGMLVPVAEFTTSAGKGQGGGRGEGTGDLTVPKWTRFSAAMAMAFGGLGIPLSINAQMVVDPSGGTTLNTAANGVPLINIVDPNAGGLSHNKFLEFNVGNDGAIFNNSLMDGQSDLGGHVMKNPHLTREASGILTEVTGTDISRIQGAMEVYGGKADLLIANPNGLFVNGVSVLNANGLTLTTGTPNADGTRFGIHGGEVEIGAGGVSTVGLDHFDVIARSIKLYGRVSGGSSRARLAAGLNDFDATTGVVTKREDGGGAGAPAFAIDGKRVDQLWGGSLYVDVNWSRGTKWLGANDVVINRFTGDTKALYYKYAGNVSWSRGIKFGGTRVDYALRSGWQYSPRHLLGANQLSIGDEFTVRGFKGASVSGDRGIYLSNTVSMPINNVFAGFVGADVGVVQNNVPNAPRQVISGFALGLKGNWKHGNFSITHAEPMQTVYKKGARDVMYATATVRF